MAHKPRKCGSLKFIHQHSDITKKFGDDLEAKHTHGNMVAVYSEDNEVEREFSQYMTKHAPSIKYRLMYPEEI